MDSPAWVYLLGLAGMGIYGTRIVVQWYMSEKSQRVESPGIYWVMSSIGAIVLYIYGWLRKDFSIILGRALATIYICGTSASWGSIRKCRGL